MSTATLPCVGQEAVYDALFDDEHPDTRATAQTKAAALCARCPSPCPDKVSAASGPRLVTDLEPGWMPDTREGRAPWHGTRAGVVTHGCTCRRCADAYASNKDRRRDISAGRSVAYGRSYIPIDQRVTAFARIAVDLLREGRTTADIATALCVTEDTALRLIDHAQQAAA